MLAAVKIRHISFDACPICGRHILSANIGGLHTNGGQFESITYLCGLVLAYIPNFSSFQFNAQCGNATNLMAKAKGLDIKMGH